MALNSVFGFVFRATDMASGVIRRLNTLVGDLGDRAGRIGTGLATAFAGGQILGTGLNAAKGIMSMVASAGDLEYRLVKLKNQAQGAGDEFIGLAKAAAFNTGLTTRVNVDDAITGMQELAKAGLQAHQVLGYLPDALKLVTASEGELGLGEVAKLFTQIQGAFGPATGVKKPTSAEIANIVAKAAMESTAGVGEVSRWITRALRGTVPFKQEFSDSIAYMMKTRGMITSPEMMSTAGGMVMQELAGSKGINFERVTGVAIRDALGKNKPLPVIIAEVLKSQRWNELGQQRGAQEDFLNKTFGKRNVTSWQAFTTWVKSGEFDEKTGKWTKGMEGVNRLIKEFRNAASEDYIGKFLIAETTTVGGLLTLIENKIKTIGRIIEDAFLPSIKPLVVWLNDVLFKFGTWVKELSPEFKKFLVIGTLVGVGMTIAAGAGLTFVGLLTAMVAALPIIVVAVKAMLIPFVVLLGLMALVVPTALAIFAAWKNNIGGAADKMTAFVEKTKLAFSVLGQLFQRGGTWGDVDKQIMDPKNSGLFNFLMNLWGLMGRIKHFFESMWEGFVETLKKVGGPLGYMLNQIERLFEAFSEGTGTTDQNRKSWERWGEVGKAVGHIFAVVAHVMLGVGTLLLELLLRGVQLFDNFDKFQKKGPDVANTLKLMTAAGFMMAGRPMDALMALSAGDGPSPVEPPKPKETDRPSEETKAIPTSYIYDWWKNRNKPTTATPGIIAAGIGSNSGEGAAATTAPVINVQPPPQTWVLQIDGREIARAATDAENSKNDQHFIQRRPNNWVQR